MKSLIALLVFSSSLTVFGYHWTVPNPSDWKVDGDGSDAILHLTVGREPPPGPRRPLQFALADTPNYRTVTIDADVRPLARSLIVVFAYRDAAHFDYAHLSTDTAIKEPNHNGIFHVYGGERVRISPEVGPPAFAVRNRWYQMHLDFDGVTGSITVRLNGQRMPALQAVDKSLASGKVGLGSFDETADFRRVRITGR